MDEEFDIAAAIEESIQVLETQHEEEEADSACPIPLPKPEDLHTDMRSHERLLVNWRMAIVYEGGKGKKTFFGRAHDLSMGGVSIYTDHNIFFEESVILLLAVPPLIMGRRERILEIHSQMVYTVLTRRGFRVGLKFLGFKPGEKKLLEERVNIRGVL
jgi:hypothetical protein